MGLTFDQFESKATPVKPQPTDDILYWAVGLGGEAGEVLNAVKKIVRDGDSIDRDHNLIEEAGDVLFYLVHVLGKRGFTLEDAAYSQLEKLATARADMMQE